MKRSAFTLIELLVVITVIALLVAILLPTINAAREYARRNQCLSQQRSLAIAMVTYDAENNGLPGYLNQFGDQDTTPIRSWVVSILPMIGENKRYEFMMKEPPVASEVAQAIAPLPALLCPSDNPDGNARLNYVVNCGPVATLTGISGNIAPHFTLYKDRRASLTTVNKKVKMEDIPDGASNTILLTENVGAGFWHQGAMHPTDELPTTSGTGTRNPDAVQNLGFIWGDQAHAPVSITGSLPPPSLPRPSSRHPATVVTAFADGSAKVINDDIGLAEWLKLVCPDDEKAKKPVADGGLGMNF